MSAGDLLTISIDLIFVPYYAVPHTNLHPSVFAESRAKAKKLCTNFMQKDPPYKF
jgi:hypothetical protein